MIPRYSIHAEAFDRHGNLTSQRWGSYRKSDIVEWVRRARLHGRSYIVTSEDGRQDEIDGIVAEAEVETEKHP